MRLAIFALAAAAVVALVPASAHAKEIVSARSCDADGCRTISGAGALRGMAEGRPTAAPVRGLPFHRVRLTVRAENVDEFAYTIAYVPSSGLLRFRAQGGGYEWLAATPQGLQGFERLTRGLEPLAGRRLQGVGSDNGLPEAKVDEVVQAPAASDGSGFPWVVVLVGAALALAVLSWRVARPYIGAHATLARDDVA